MPSSLIFAGLVTAWLVVLVPMIAKGRQEVHRTADSALTSRVLRRPAPGRAPSDHDEERAVMTEQRSAHEAGPHGEPGERPFRPGRGGFDPEAAALAARARYAVRQRVVIGLLVATVGSVALALTVSAGAWWVTGAVVGLLAAYLAYLRQQVRIEEEVRRRRADRLRRVHRDREALDEIEVEDAEDGEGIGGTSDGWEDRRTAPDPPRAPSVREHPRVVVVDVDDDDPAFDELDPTFEPPYRRAVGE